MYIFWLRFSLKKIYWKIFALCDDKLFIVFNSKVWLSTLNIYDLVSSISWADDIQWNHILLISFTVRGTVDNSISFCIFIEDLWIFFFKMIRSEKSLGFEFVHWWNCNFGPDHLLSLSIYNDQRKKSYRRISRILLLGPLANR